MARYISRLERNITKIHTSRPSLFKANDGWIEEEEFPRIANDNLSFYSIQEVWKYAIISRMVKDLSFRPGERWKMRRGPLSRNNGVRLLEGAGATGRGFMYAAPLLSIYRSTWARITRGRGCTPRLHRWIRAMERARSFLRAATLASPIFGSFASHSLILRNSPHRPVLPLPPIFFSLFFPLPSTFSPPHSARNLLSTSSRKFFHLSLPRFSRIFFTSQGKIVRLFLRVRAKLKRTRV